MYDSEGLIICQECQRSFKFITARHLKLHGLTTAEYCEKYPGIALSRKGFYDSIKNKRREKPVNEPKPVIEELEEIEIGENFKEDDSIVILAKNKIPRPSKNLDPMDDKIEIIAYLKTIFSNIKNNYIFEKKNPNGAIEKQIITDMADPSYKIIFDFPNAFWHNQDMSVSNEVKKQILKSHGWKLIEIFDMMPKVENVDKELKDRKF